MNINIKTGQLRAFILSAVSVLVIVTTLFFPWVRVAGLSTYASGVRVFREGYLYFSIINFIGLRNYANTAVEIMNVTTMTARLPAIYAISAAVVLSSFAYLWLLFNKNRRSAFFGFFAFLAFIGMSLFFLDTVAIANMESAHAGPGIFTDNFLSVTPLAYVPIFFCIFVAAIILPYAVVTISEEYEFKLEQKATKRSAYKGAPIANRLKPMLRDILRDRWLYVLLIPFLAYYALFFWRPYSGLRIAFMNFMPLWGFENSPWVGLDNFITFFTGPFFWRVFRNTLIVNVYQLLWAFPLPIILAVLFNEVRSRKFRTLAQTISYLPFFISSMVIVGLVVNMLSPTTGVINTVLGWFNIEPIHFIMQTRFYRTIFISQGIWAGVGFGSIIYYSAIVGIDSELFEAAAIDGAGRLKQIRHIMFPCLLPTISIMLILAVGGIVGSATEMHLLLQQPATFEVSDVIGTYIFRLGMASAFPQFSLATAVGMFEGVLACILVLSANKISKRVSETSII